MACLVFLRNDELHYWWWVQGTRSEPCSGDLGLACGPTGGEGGKGQQAMTACPGTAGICLWPLCSAPLPQPGKVKARADPSTSCLCAEGAGRAAAGSRGGHPMATVAGRSCRVQPPVPAAARQALGSALGGCWRAWPSGLGCSGPH